MRRKLAIALTLVLVLVILVPSEALAQSVVDGNIGNASGFRYSYERRSFHAAGLEWAFYVEASNLNFRTTSDYVTWSAATTIRSVGAQDSERFSVSYDAPFGYYAASDGVNTYFRKFTPNANGTMTWVAAEQTVVAAASAPNLTIDSSGHPWIVSGATVYKSSTTSGTWVEDVANGFPYAVGTNMTTLIPLTSGRMFLMNGGSSSKMMGKRYVPPADGGPAWGALVYGTSNVESTHYYCAVGESDTVHTVFLKDVTYDIVYTTYSYSTNTFGAETVVAAATADAVPAISRNTATNDLDVYWLNSGTEKVYFARMVGGVVWSGDYNIVTDPDGINQGTNINSAYYTSGSGDQGVYYGAGAAASLMVKFKHLSEPFDVDTLTPSPIAENTATLRGEITSLGFGNADERGIYYDTAPSLGNTTGTLVKWSETGSFGVGVFTQGFTGFTEGQSYYCITYATNDFGTSYGEWVEFIPGGTGGWVVLTLDPTDIEDFEATFNADITEIAGTYATVHGFQYGYTATPTWSWTETGSFTVGSYSYIIDTLDADQIYYVRALAGNSTVVDYGQWIGFITEQPSTTDPWSPGGGNDTLIPVPPEPGGWVLPSPVTSPTSSGGSIGNTIIGALLNPFLEASGFPIEFIYWTMACIICELLCLAAYALSKHLFVVFCAGALVIGYICALQLIDWWLIFPYIAMGIGLMVNEKQFAF